MNRLADCLHANPNRHPTAAIYRTDPKRTTAYNLRPMIYPASLQPTTTESMTLPISGRIVAFPKATPTFAKWPGEFAGSTYGKKAVLDFNGRPAFAELAILWTLQNDGWQGVWVDKKVFRTDFWNSPPQRTLPQKPSSLPDEIWNLAKTPPGVWDVFCWQDDRVLFCECKRGKRDEIQQSQLIFAESALNLGLPLDSFLFVEWTTE